MEQRDHFPLRTATSEDRIRIHFLLEEAGLPTSDLRDNPDVRFLVTVDDDRISGCVGIELYGSLALIRSLAVDTGLRTRGVGSSLLHAAERVARDHGVRHAYLLTSTAESFFRQRGYANIDRAYVPSRIAASTEYSAVCPASATLMCKRV